MKALVAVPRGALSNKPPHGAPCNRCGLCCLTSLCQLAQLFFDRPELPGPCPALVEDADGKFGCGLVQRTHGPLQKAALLMINADNGCDARFNNEPRNEAYTAKMNEQDQNNWLQIGLAIHLWREAAQAVRDQGEK